MSTTSDLIAQLRAMVALTNETPRIPALPRALATDAANRLDELERENARLREALEPFAAMADDWSPNFNDTQGFSTRPMPNYEAGDLKFAPDFIMGDLRRARAALEERTP
jgi:hypothetical protein